MLSSYEHVWSITNMMTLMKEEAGTTEEDKIKDLEEDLGIFVPSSKKTSNIWTKMKFGIKLGGNKKRLSGLLTVGKKGKKKKRGKRSLSSQSTEIL